MKKLPTALALTLLIFSCAKKETSQVPDFSSSSAPPSSAPTNSAAAPPSAMSGDKSLPGYALIHTSDCLSCHQENEKLVGPSYAEIATKYTEKDTQLLAEKILNGGSGVWGTVPMAPHANMPHEDAVKMVQYILSLR